MGRHTKPPTAAARLFPLAAGAGAGLLLVAAAVGLTRQRAEQHRHEAPRHVTPARPAARRDLVEADAGVTPPRSTGHAPAARPTTKIAPIAIAAALVLVSLGVGFVGMAVASQRSLASTPAPVRAPEAAAGRDVEAWQPVVDTRPHDVPPRRPAAPAAAPAPPAPAPAAPRLLGRSVPMSLDIPAIGVRSVLRAVGQAEDGSMETPAPGPYYNDAAWYRHSPTPGSIGPAILLGHVDSAAEGPSVFFRLGELTAGDRIAVTRADGSVGVFRVDRVRRYAKDNFPTDLVYGDIDHAGLRLVTCGGAFDNTSGHYLDNVVVFASLVGTG